jgi:fructose-1,6-bisphosphatase I
MVATRCLKKDTAGIITTVQQHILQEQRKRFPKATGSFSWLLSGITLATKMTEARVRRAGLLDVLGGAGHINVQGEQQQKLDAYADQALMHCLGIRENVAIVASEDRFVQSETERWGKAVREAGATAD